MINAIQNVGTHNLYEIDLKLSDSEVSLPEVGESISSIFFVTSIENHRLLYLNSTGIKWLSLGEETEVDYEEIELKDYFEDDEERWSVDDHDKQITLSLQKVWYSSDLEFKLCLVAKLPRINDVLNLIIPLKDWTHFKQRLINLLEEEEFILRNHHRYEELTKREKEIVQLISLGLNSREISDQLFISRHTVEQHRKNINRKLEVSSVAELVEYGRIFYEKD